MKWDLLLPVGLLSAALLLIFSSVFPQSPDPLRIPVPSRNPAGWQGPVIRVDGKESNGVFLQKLDVTVRIAGHIAATTWTLVFTNRTDRILEGELTFPLGEGISISGYALDINGRLRQAVPVEKEKATRVFESTERRRIDPGLLEKVEGNSFRTRIYPFAPHGSRTVQIAYQEELDPGGNGDLVYRLPLKQKQDLDEFTIGISVIHSTNKPFFAENLRDELSFGEWQNTWTLSKKLYHFRADRTLSLHIPKEEDGGDVMMQQDGGRYFYLVNHFPQVKAMPKKLPGRITILWDASLSGLSRNKEQELDLLGAYIDKLQHADISLVRFSNTVGASLDFHIEKGRWDALRSALQQVVYDGATHFGALDLTRYPCDEFLLFSDGQGTYGMDAPVWGDKPVHCISSSPSSDFPFLQYISRRTGGEWINLGRSGPGAALNQLTSLPLQFMGIKPSESLADNYPSLPMTVIRGVSVAGISYRPEQDLVLEFGYGGKVVLEKTLRLDFAKHGVDGIDLQKSWAQKKIAELELEYDQNKMAIRQLGRQYGIVTRNTSLIVLENISDYVNNDIEPPVELRPEYDRLIKQKANSAVQRRQMTVENAERIGNDLINWWNTDYHLRLSQKESPRVLDTAIVAANAGYNLRRTPRERQDTIPLTMPSAPAMTALQGRVAGVAIHSSNELQEVVVTARGTTRQSRTLSYSVTTAGAKDREASQREYMQDASSPGQTEERGAVDPQRGGLFQAAASDTRTDYLDSLRKTPAKDRYARYLSLRKEHQYAPVFYLNTGNFFIAEGQKEMGLKILSNLAELDLEDYEIGKMLGYKLRELGEAGAACAVFRKVLEWRPFEPQSWRDYGLALESAGFYQQALDTLIEAIQRNYDDDISARYPGLEETLLPEINQLVASKADRLDIRRVPPRLIRNLPVDIRVVLNWNMNDTDIDLWVTDPEGEKCYYSHKSTLLGGRISNDFTNGLGPEQFLLKKAVRGKYKVEVNYYGDRQVKLAGPTTLMVEVYVHYGSPDQTSHLMTLTMLPESKGTVFVGEFEF